MANQAQLQSRLTALQKEMKPVTKSMITTAISGVHPLLLAAYTQGPLAAMNVMLAVALSYPPFLYKINNIHKVKVASEREYKPADNQNKNYQEYLQDWDKYLTTYEQQLNGLKYTAETLNKYGQPALMVASIGIALLGFPPANAVAHTALAVGIYFANQLYRKHDPEEVMQMRREALGLRAH
ncbi:MAG TPA: hypothetical protein VI522_00875 [Gammaproteobacteria bacterium]|nr:hypothetical protein [Gammaproteobacteria bacterium]